MCGGAQVRGWGMGVGAHARLACKGSIVQGWLRGAVRAQAPRAPGVRAGNARPRCARRHRAPPVCARAPHAHGQWACAHSHGHRPQHARVNAWAGRRSCIACCALAELRGGWCRASDHTCPCKHDLRPILTTARPPVPLAPSPLPVAPCRLPLARCPCVTWPGFISKDGGGGLWHSCSTVHPSWASCLHPPGLCRSLASSPTRPLLVPRLFTLLASAGPSPLHPHGLCRSLASLPAPLSRAHPYHSLLYRPYHPLSYHPYHPLSRVLAYHSLSWELSYAGAFRVSNASHQSPSPALPRIQTDQDVHTCAYACPDRVTQTRPFDTEPAGSMYATGGSGMQHLSLCMQQVGVELLACHAGWGHATRDRGMGMACGPGRGMGSQGMAWLARAWHMGQGIGNQGMACGPGHGM
eukprot:365888-Chlamydomonas_euryale.AAC.4